MWISAIEKGYYHRIIADSAFRYQKEIEEKKRVIVGINEFVEDEETEIELRDPDPEFEKKKAEDLIELKKNRDQNEVKASLREIREIIQGSDNVMPVLIKAVKAYVSLGEIISVMREIFGEFYEDTIY